MNRLIRVLGLGIGLCCATASAQSGQAAAAVAEFPRPASLEPAVSFWRKVFSEYSEGQIVLHSMDYPQKVYAVLDYRDDLARGVNEADIARRARADEKLARARIQALLKSVHAQRGQPDAMNADARKLFELFADVREKHPTVYLEQADRIRAQRGLRERTERALAIAGRYLPHMEAVFATYQLPTGLTRLPLVESSFNVDAYSKVGAAGLWQFMPSTARIYMRLDEVVDDRRDPWFSTDAAARHLRDDYSLLKQWPLAVTAYNYGRVGVARALKSVEGESLEDLIDRFDGRRFGFASRNFYAEFLAALDVERERGAHFGDVKPEDAVDFDAVKTANYVPYDTLRQISGLDEARFRRLNPAYRDEVVEGKLYVPPNHEIRVPRGKGAEFGQAYAALRADQVFSAQRAYWIQYKVSRGDTLGGIARRYGTSVRDIQRANGLSNPRYIRIGQLLKVPPRGVDGGAGRSAAPKLQAAALHHRVRRGETLSQIAQRYGTNVAALQALNGIAQPSQLRAGQTLKLRDEADAGLQQVAYSKPAEADYRLHRVRSGETVSGIARRYGLSGAAVSRYNGLSDPDSVRAGTLLKIPVE